MVMEKAEMYRKGMSREVARKKLFERIGAPGEVIILRNINDDEEVFLGRQSVRKLLSGAASDKSVANGFTPAQHFAVAADIADVFLNSVKVLERPDRNGNQDITIHRFAAPLHFDGAIALITVKEIRLRGKKLYSVELMEIKELGGTLEKARGVSHTRPRPEFDIDGGGMSAHPGNPPRETPSAPRLYTDNIRHLLEKVNSKSKKI